MTSEQKPQKSESTASKSNYFFSHALIRGLLATSKPKKEKEKPRHE